MKHSRRTSRWLFLTIAVQLALGLMIIVVTPMWAEHEPDFYNVVRFMLDNGRMPTAADYPPGEADVRQATQPPLFFIAAMPIVSLLDDTQPVPPGVHPGLVCVGGEATNATLISYPPTAAYQFPVYGSALAGYGLRVINLVFGMIAVVFTYLAGRVLFPECPAIGLIGAALLAFEPNTLQMVTTISNDALLLPIAAASLYCGARMLTGGAVRWRWALPLIGLSALAILTRLSGWAVLGFALLVFLYAIGRTLWDARRRAGRGQVRAALIVLALLILAVIGVGAFNYSQYGTVFGRYRELDELMVRAFQNFNLPLETVVGVLTQTQTAYEVPLNALASRRAILTAYSLAAVVALLGALLGLIAAVVRRWRKQGTSALGAYLLLIAGVGVGFTLVLFRNTINVSAGGGVTLYNTATIFAPIRYYNAALPPLALLLSAGLMVWLEPIRSRASLRNILSAHPLGIGLAILWAVVALLGAVAAIQNRPSVRVFPNGVTVRDAVPVEETQPEIALQVPMFTANPRPQDGVIDLRLYAISTEPLLLNYAAQIDMMVDGRTVNSCQFLPARGYYPTPLWSSQSVVELTSTIPNCAGEIDMPIDLSLRWLGADMNGVIQQESPPISLGTIDPPLAQAAACPPTLGILAGGYRVTQFNSPTSVQMGAVYLPSANWIVTERSPEVAERVFLFTHEATGTEYTCGASDNPAAVWVQGEYKFFDRCPMTFPPEAPLGEYAVSVIMVNSAGERLPATNAAGEPAQDNAVRIGSVTLEE